MAHPWNCAVRQDVRHKIRRQFGRFPGQLDIIVTVIVPVWFVNSAWIVSRQLAQFAILVRLRCGISSDITRRVTLRITYGACVHGSNVLVRRSDQNGAIKCRKWISGIDVACLFGNRRWNAKICIEENKFKNIDTRRCSRYISLKYLLYRHINACTPYHYTSVSVNNVRTKSIFASQLQCVLTYSNITIK